MKKKILVLVLVCAIVLGSLGVFAGCSKIITKNTDRVQAQVIATINYEGDSSVVTYGQVFEAFNSYGYYYVSYYGYTVEDTLDMLLNQLANRELLILYAKKLVVQQKGLAGAPKDYTLEQLLTKAEINKAIEATNEQMVSAVESLMTELKTEDEANAGETDTYDGNTYSVTFENGNENATGTAPVQDDVESGTEITLPANSFELTDKAFKGWSDGTDTYAAADKYTVGNGNVTFTAVWGEKIPDARPVRSEVETKTEDDDYDANDDTVTLSPKFLDGTKLNPAYVNEELTSNPYFADGMKTLLKNISSNKKDYDYYLQSQYKTLIVERLEIILRAEKTAPTEAEVQAEYARIIAENKASFSTDATAYETAVKDVTKTTVYHHPVTNYGYVRNMLLKFDDDEWADLDAILDAGDVYTDEQVKAYADNLAHAKTIWISNPNYTTEAGEAADEHVIGEAGACSVCGEAQTIDYNNLIVYDSTEDKVVYNCGCCAAEPYLAVKWPAYDQEATATEPAKVGVLTQMKNSFDAVKADTSLSELEKLMMLKELSTCWTYLVCDDSGSFAGADSYNELGYFMTADGKTSSYLEEFTAEARDRITQGAGSYTNSTDDTFGAVVYSASSGYGGIFVIMSTYCAYDKSFVDEVTLADGYEGKTTAEYVSEQILPLDYVIATGTDASACKTLRDTIYDSLKESNEKDYYNTKANQFIAANKDAGIVKNEKLWEQIIEEATAS